MKKILVLGGAGAQAAYAVEKLVADDYFDEIVIGDYNKENADAFVKKLNNPKVKAVQIDVLDKEALVPLMNEADVVANCTGPYYKLLMPVLDALMESTCKNYVDLCDDISVFEQAMTPERMKEAEERGMRIILGLGGSPGLIPIEIMYANSLMDEAEKVHLYMLMDELNEGGTAVWDHMFENFYGTVHVWKDNKLQTEKGLEVEEYYEFDEYVFKDTGKVRVHSLGHPEVYTLPKVLPHLEEIKIKTAFYPPKVQDLVVDFNRIGLLNTEPIKVGDVEVAPRAVLLELMKDTVLNPDFKGGFDPSHREPEELISGSSIEVYGKKDGKEVLYKSAFNTLMGPVTGYPLAVGAKMLAKGEIEPVGIMIPEQAITKQGEFVEEVFTSIDKAGHPIRRKAEVKYSIGTI